jgi:predicted site-specific integrase-resolvase
MSDPTSSLTPEADSSDAEFTCLARIARVLNVHPTTATRLAAAGQIRVSAVPGRRIRYSEADARRVAAQLG